MSRYLLLCSLAVAFCVAAAPARESPTAGRAATEAAAATPTETPQRRLQALEENVVRLQQQVQMDQEALEQGRQRQARFEAAAHAVPWLVGLVVVLAAVAVALAWRVQSLSRRRRDAWWDTSAPLDLDTPRDESPVTAAVVFNELAALNSQTRPPDVPVAAQVLPVSEQLALSQQVALLCALGQEPQAIELLEGRLERGADTPWLLLKLMALYQRSGQRAAFDGVARQAVARFGGVAPAWEAPLQAPGGLDGEPVLLQALQQAWASPVDALQALAALLLQPRCLPSLAACEDLLLLYRVAHERHCQEVAAAPIDVPLPLEAAPAAAQAADRRSGLAGQVELQPAP